MSRITPPQLPKLAIWISLPWIIGILVSLILPTDQALSPIVEKICVAIGWGYFISWSLSFYPQAISNFLGQSVVGLSFDFQLLNFLGFLSYSIYNCSLYWNKTIRDQYASLHKGAKPAVRLNDVVFSLHACCLTLLTLLQCYLYKRGSQKVHRATIFAAIITVLASLVYAAAIIIIQSSDIISSNSSSSSSSSASSNSAITTTPPSILLLLSSSSTPTSSSSYFLSWLCWLYTLSYIKLTISLIKYLPQVHLNWQRHSTKGWNIVNVLLDFQGGMLSLLQLLLDAAATSDWSAVTGNPVKFCLGFVSMVFDVVFMIQHWVFYPSNSSGYSNSSGLVGDGDGDGWGVYEAAGNDEDGNSDRQSGSEVRL